jgi:4-amino-4-deoxy-L-arabinose transferase-like glycosyltransferase
VGTGVGTAGKLERTPGIVPTSPTEASLAPERSPLRPLAVVLAAALAARLAAVAAANDTLVLDERLYVDLGRGLGGGTRVMDPWYAPLYPGLLAAVFGTFGEGLLAPRIVHALLGTATVALVFALGSRLFGRGAGLAGALVAALLPETVGYAPLFYTEHVFLPLLVAALLSLVAAMDAPERTARFTIAGLLLGAAALAREAALAVAPVAAAFAALVPGSPVARARRALALSLGFALVAGSWMGVNAARHGTFALTANRWKPILEGNGTPADLAEFREVFEKDRFAGEAFARERALERIAEAQPLWLARKTAKAFAGLFGPNSFLYRQARLASGSRDPVVPLAAIGSPLLALVLVAGAAGLLAAPQDRRVALLGAAMAALFALHVLSLALNRHRLPFLPILAVGAGHLLHGLAADRGALRGLARPIPCAGVAAAAAAVALAWVDFIATGR